MRPNLYDFVGLVVDDWPEDAIGFNSRNYRVRNLWTVFDSEDITAIRKWMSSLSIDADIDRWQGAHFATAEDRTLFLLRWGNK